MCVREGKAKTKNRQILFRREGTRTEGPTQISETPLASAEVISVNCFTNQLPERKHRELLPRPTIILHVPAHLTSVVSHRMAIVESLSTCLTCATSSS